MPRRGASPPGFCHGAPLRLQESGAIHHALNQGNYLEWLMEDEPAQKAMKFDRMSRGWVVDSKAFKTELEKEYRQAMAARERGENDLDEAREVAHQTPLDQFLQRVHKNACAPDDRGKIRALDGGGGRGDEAKKHGSEPLAFGEPSHGQVSRQVSAWRRAPDRILAKKLP